MLNLYPEDELPYSSVFNPWPCSVRRLSIQQEGCAVLQSSFQVWMSALQWI